MSAPGWTRRATSSRGITNRGLRRWETGPGTGTPGNVITGLLAGFQPQPFAPRRPPPHPRSTTTTATACLPTSRARGRHGPRHRQGQGRARAGAQRRSPFWTGPLRSPARLQNTFAHECFMDELAARVKADPVEYRLRHLNDPRLIDVVKAAAKAAKWDARPSPNPARSARRRRHGPRHGLRALRRRQRIYRHGRRGRSESGYRAR